MEKLRLCYVHNVPNNPVFIDVDSVKQAIDTKEVIANGGRVVINPILEGFSTTSIIETVKKK